MKVTPRPLIDPKFVLSHRRRRLAYALGEVCVEKGFQAATVGDVASRAKVSRNTIYEAFSDKEAIFLSLVADSEAELLRRIEVACLAAGNGEGQHLQAGLAGALKWVAEEPVYAWTLLVEVFRAGPESLRMYFGTVDRLSAALRDVVPPEISRPTLTEEALVGGAAGILRGALRAGDAEDAQGLLPELTVLFRAPYSVRMDLDRHRGSAVAPG